MAPRTKSHSRSGPSVRKHLYGADTGHDLHSSHGADNTSSNKDQQRRQIHRMKKVKADGRSTNEGRGLDSESTDAAADDADGSDDQEEDEETDLDPERSAPSRGFRVSKKNGEANSGNVDADDGSFSGARRRRTGRTKESSLASPFSSPKKKKISSNLTAHTETTTHSKGSDDASDGADSCDTDLKITLGDKAETSSNNGSNRRLELGADTFLADLIDSSTNYWEEDDYTGVDRIDIVEENGRELKILEEEYIIDSEEKSGVVQRSTQSSDSDCHPSEPEDGLLGDLLLYGQGDDNVLAFSSEAAFVLESFSHNKKTSNNTSKRVRFQDEFYETDSSTMSSEQDSVIFPDIFEMKEREDQRHALENRNTLQEALFPSDSEGYWDLYADGLSSDTLGDSADTEDSEAGSSGYETDAGDTTDEEDPPPHVHNPNFRLQRQPSGSASETTATPPPTAKGNQAGTRRKGPVMGQFVVDPSKAILVLDQNRPLVFPARMPPAQTDTAGGGISNTPAALPPFVHDYMYSMNADPMKFFPTRKETMFHSLLTPVANPDAAEGEILGPPEAFYPFFSIDRNGNIIEEEERDWYEDDDEDDDAMNIHDFIDFGESENDDNGTDRKAAEETDFTETSMAGTDLESTMSITPKGDRGVYSVKSDNALRHLSGGGVTAFRSNQDRYRIVSREPHHPALRYTIQNAVQAGRAAAAEEPITPLRRKRKTSAAFPMQGGPLAKKAKQAHHRRSLSDLTH